MLKGGRHQTVFKAAAAIPPQAKEQGHPPQQKAVAARYKQPPQQPKRFAEQTFRIGCRSNQNAPKATNYVFCSYIYADVILPNRSFNPHPKMGQVNMFNKNETMKFEQHGKRPCYSNRFDHHVFREINLEKQIKNRCNEQPLCLTCVLKNKEKGIIT